VLLVYPTSTCLLPHHPTVGGRVPCTGEYHRRGPRGPLEPEPPALLLSRVSPRESRSRLGILIIVRERLIEVEGHLSEQRNCGTVLSVRYPARLSIDHARQVYDYPWLTWGTEIPETDSCYTVLGLCSVHRVGLYSLILPSYGRSRQPAAAMHLSDKTCAADLSPPQSLDASASPLDAGHPLRAPPRPL